MASAPKVLAVIDPASDQRRALERGVVFAGGLGAKLEVLVVVYDQFVEHDAKAKSSLMRHQREAVESMTKPAADGVREISVDARWGRPFADEVLKKVDETRPALVVKATEHHSILKRTLLTNADWELIRHCPVPLLLAKDRDISGSPKFLAAIDPGKHNDKPDSLDRRILELGKQLSVATGGTLQPLHVLDTRLLAEVNPIVAGTGMAQGATATPVMTPMGADDIEQLKQDRKELLNDLCAQVGIEAPNDSLRIGSPEIVLIETAEDEQFDFVVLGAVTRGIIDRILIGHTAEKILDRLPCDMIVVNSKGMA